MTQSDDQLSELWHNAEAPLDPALVVRTLVLLTAIVGGVRCELFSSLAGLEQIFAAHQHALRTLNDYIVDEEARLDELRKYAKCSA